MLYIIKCIVFASFLIREYPSSLNFSIREEIYIREEIFARDFFVPRHTISL